MAGERLDLTAAIAHLAEFFDGGDLNSRILDLEKDLNTVGAAAAGRVARDANVNADLLEASVQSRRDLGRLNELIHAAGIALACPLILEEGEHITERPCLAAGNDPSRTWDLQTNRRVAEFKFAVWTGSDARRQRTTFKDLVKLALHDGRAELYVVGHRPVHWLKNTTAKASWGLKDWQPMQAEFANKLGALDTPISEFVAERLDLPDDAGGVRLFDLAEEYPAEFGVFAEVS